MAEDPKVFMNMVELLWYFGCKAKVKYIQKARQLMEETKRNIHNLNIVRYLLGNYLPDIYSGYRSPNLEKFTEMVVYFSEKIAPFKTKMNKLLFYSDFLMFKQSCFSISGMRYKAIDMGPVPNNFQSIFEYIANKDELDIFFTELPKGYMGEQFKAEKTERLKLICFRKRVRVLEGGYCIQDHKYQ